MLNDLMTGQKRSLVILGFVLVVLTLLLWVIWGTTGKVLQVFFIDRDDHVITQAPLTNNVCKRYGNKATFDIQYKGEVVEGRDGCLLFADKGDVVKVYFNKKNLYDNGIVAELIFLFVGQWVLFLLIVGYFVRRSRAYYPTKNMLP